MSITCPECGREFEKSTQFNPHWGRSHEGETPDEIDTSKPCIQGENNPHSDGREVTWGDKISEAKEGTELSEEHKEKLRGPRPNYSGKNHHMYGRTGEEHPTYGSPPPEESGFCDWYYIEELNSKVQGKFEKRVVEYILDEINPERVSVQDCSFNYCVDIVVDNVAIEVKSRLWEDIDNISKAEQFIEEYGSNYNYVVVGKLEETEQIPNDKHFYENELNELVNYVN